MNLALIFKKYVYDNNKSYVHYTQGFNNYLIIIIFWGLFDDFNDYLSGEIFFLQKH